MRKYVNFYSKGAECEMDEYAIWFVEDSGKPVGYALGFPDLNETAPGRRDVYLVVRKSLLEEICRIFHICDYRLIAVARYRRYILKQDV